MSRLSIASLPLAIVVLVGCQPAVSESQPKSAPPSPSSPLIEKSSAPVIPKPEDKPVSAADRVSGLIRIRRFIDSSRVIVDGEGGAVTVRGVVKNERDRQAILGIARKTEGVTKVIDHLKVQLISQ